MLIWILLFTLSEAEPDLNLVAKMIGLHADPDPDLQFFLRTRSQE
jgi:hypothetical protein